jgi:serine/threonine protein phosphatase PrpC
MEDVAFVARLESSTSSYVLAGIADGHGGGSVAQAAARAFPGQLAAEMRSSDVKTAFGDAFAKLGE